MARTGPFSSALLTPANTPAGAMRPALRVSHIPFFAVGKPSLWLQKGQESLGKQLKTEEDQTGAAADWRAIGERIPGGESVEPGQMINEERLVEKAEPVRKAEEGGANNYWKRAWSASGPKALPRRPTPTGEVISIDAKAEGDTKGMKSEAAWTEMMMAELMMEPESMTMAERMRVPEAGEMRAAAKLGMAAKSLRVPETVAMPQAKMATMGVTKPGR